MELIKDQTLIVSTYASITDPHNQTYTLRTKKPDDTKVHLSDVFNRLPNGLINKYETGIGATYLELISPRNSIVVEPLKVTASSKAHSKKHPACYVGSETILHAKATPKSIQAYIHKVKGFKKFIVVADSLPKLIAQLGDSAYSDYVLLIDEIDSFQLDATFRDSMEHCIDIYTRFPADKRILVSATPLKFTDSRLSSEPVTTIKYDQSQPHSINVIATLNLTGTAADRIKRLIQQYAGAKFFIAYNNVAGCFDLAEDIVKTEGIDRSDISILCSRINEKKLPYYYRELTSALLPTRINFVSSAYFTGFDIEERYHLITLSSVLDPIYTLSELKMKQIRGRCRHVEGLMSETIIYDYYEYYEDFSHFTLPEIISAANAEITALHCISSNFENEPILKQSFHKIRDMVTEQTLCEGFRFVRINANSEPAISYLNVDAYIEHCRVFEIVYRGKYKLPKLLKLPRTVIDFEEDMSEYELSKKNITKKHRERLIDEAIGYIEDLEPTDILSLSSKFRDMDKVQREIINCYDEHRYYVDNDKLLQIVKDSVLESRDNRALKNSYRSLLIATMNSNDIYRRNLAHHFQEGGKYSRQELIYKWNKFFTELPLTTGQKIKDGDFDKAVEITTKHFTTTRAKDNSRIIKSLYPLGLTRDDITGEKPEDKGLDYNVFLIQMGMNE